MNTIYYITVINKHHISKGKVEIELDGKKLEDNLIKLVDDGIVHQVKVVMKEDDNFDL